MNSVSRRQSILREMGLGPLWRLRGGDETAVVEGPQDTDSLHNPEGLSPITATETPVRLAAAVSEVVTALTHAGNVLAAPVSSADKPRAHPDSIPTEPSGGLSEFPRADTLSSGRAARIAGLDWEALEAEIKACQACGLCRQRKQAVPGVGDRQAQWMLVGEGPGAEEDQRGEPFVGQAGRLLDNMLSAIGLARQENVYIANAVKCRPPHNRTPEAGEVATCLPYLERQIELVKPRLLVALGRPAAQALTGTEVRIGAARGRLFLYKDIPLIVTYHPAYLLRNPQDKSKAWEDLCFARRTMAES